jgi:exodeoxyribonuclease V gamma subunit
MLVGEVESSPYLQRVWPDFAALSASGEFAHLAEILLRRLYQATFARAGRTAKTGAGEPA